MKMLPKKNELSKTSPAQNGARFILGAMLTLAGISHLTVSRREFRAQVPRWVPLDPDSVVLISGLVEVVLGLAVCPQLPIKKRIVLGWIVAVSFAVIFP